MASVLSTRSLRAIEKGIREGKCLTLIPDRKGSARVVESEEFLSAAESDELMRGITQPTPGTYLEQFIWEYEDGNTKAFAGRVDYHPNRISTLKSSATAISTRLFRRMAEAYKLGKKDREFWARGLLQI